MVLAIMISGIISRNAEFPGKAGILMGGAKYKAAIFDLDGVLVDTAEYHYLAWNALANRINAPFSRQLNERLKGVSRSQSLEILLESVPNQYSQIEKKCFMDEKNNTYVSYLQTLTKQNLLPGAEHCLLSLKKRGVKLALGTASKNAPLILAKLGIHSVFDTIVDGNSVRKAKPDPEIFISAADRMGVEYQRCVVFEDSAAGIQAAICAGMYPIGVGEPENLPHAQMWVDSLADFVPDNYF